jgi:hypothetical protein
MRGATAKRASDSVRLVPSSRAQDVARAIRGVSAGTRSRKLAWTTIVLALFAVGGLVRLSRPVFVNPTDAALAHRLEQHPADFLNLAVQLQHDAAAPTDEYRARLRSLGLHDARSEATGIVTFPASAWWPSLLGDIKGFAFSARTPQPIVSSLDRLEVVRKPGKQFRFYKSLGGDWYAYREIRTPRF